MGRGRQKAKHTKIARELKSFSPEVDYDQLERELGGKSPDPSDEEMSKWSEYADEFSSDQHFSSDRQRRA